MKPGENHFKIFYFIIINLRRIYNSNMAANESVFSRSIGDVVGEALRDLRASVSETAFSRLDWLLDNFNRYADSRQG